MGLLLLDLDGTLVKDALIEQEGKLQRPQDQLYTEPVLGPNVYEVIDRAAYEGDRFAICTNQGGVAWGYHTRAESELRVARTVHQLRFFHGRPFTVHIAFHHPRATVPEFKLEAENDPYRKPGAGMLLEAIEAHSAMADAQALQAAGTVMMVGDREEDRLAAEAAGVDFTTAGDFFAW